MQRLRRYCRDYIVRFDNISAVSYVLVKHQELVGGSEIYVSREYCAHG